MGYLCSSTLGSWPIFSVLNPRPISLRPRPPLQKKKYCKTFLIHVSSRCKSYFSWIFTYINFYLLTTHNWVKQIYFCMIGSFVIANKIVWRFNGETFVKQSVKLVPSVKLLLPEKWTQGGCLYGYRNKFSYPYWPGDQNCFCLHGMFKGKVSSIWNKCDHCIL